MTDERGEPWFVGKDVAEALGYKKPENALSVHVGEEDKTTTLIQGNGSNYKTRAIVINESGLYCLILSSKLPSAKAFKRWVTAEVLPQIRKTGGYIPTKDGEGHELSETEIIRRGVEIIGNTIALRNQQNSSCLTATEVARRFGMEVQSFNNLLQRMDIQHRKGGRWVLNEALQGMGLAEDRFYMSFSLRGRPKLTEYLVWTPEGVAFLDAMTRRLGGKVLEVRGYFEVRGTRYGGNIPKRLND